MRLFEARGIAVVLLIALSLCMVAGSWSGNEPLFLIPFGAWMGLPIGFLLGIVCVLQVERKP